MAAPPWLTARLVVLGTLAGAHYAFARLQLTQPWIRVHLDQGILGWDAERYRQIAAHGYAALPQRELRFFPLLPLLTRLFAFVTRLPTGVALIVLANVAALAFGALVHRLVVVETADERLATRAVWLTAFTPAGFVLVWGYSEALFGALTVLAFLGLRSRRWWLAAAAGLAAGVARPVGVLLALPAALEALRGIRGVAPREVIGRAAAIGAAPVGASLYCAWVGTQFGDPWLPFRVQQSAAFRRSVVDPAAKLWSSGQWLVGGHVTGDALHFVWAAVAIASVVVAFRRWPASYGAFAAGVVLVALSASRLGSFERYAFGAFPVVFALAAVTDRDDFGRAALAVSAAAFAVYGTLALLGAYTP